MRPKCNNYKEIYEYYYKVAKHLSEEYKKGMYLKTDSHNESGIYPISKPIVPVLSENGVSVNVVEYSTDVLNKAKPLLDQFKNVYYSRGDIRTPLSKKFDVIFDFSTIDHVPITDVPHVLNNYKESLKTGGQLSLFVWLSDTKENSEGEWNPSNQYFFYKPEFEKYLYEYFSVINKEYVLNLNLAENNSPRKVYWYLCEVKNGM